MGAKLRKFVETQDICTFFSWQDGVLWKYFLNASGIFFVLPPTFRIFAGMKKVLLRCVSLMLFLCMALCAAGRDSAAVEKAGKKRLQHLLELYNNDLNDSLIHQAERDMAFYKANKLWEFYFDTWMHVVNTYNFSGRVNMALMQVKLMHEDASQRNDVYGMALASYAMGNAYINMGYNDEAISCYKQCIALSKNVDNNNMKVLNDVYSYYCDALNDAKRYSEMPDVIREWNEHIRTLMKKPENAQKSHADVWWAYYYLACAQYNLGTGNLVEAEAAIDSAAVHSKGNGDFVPMSVLFYRAELYLKRQDYQQAYVYNSRRLEKSLDYDDMSSMLLIYEQRAKILSGMEYYKESAEMYRKAYELSDSIYKKDVRTQINELNTMFRVSEIELVQRLERNRAVTMTVVVLAIALALLVGYWYWTSRRLRRTNGELAIARDQAQESLRMKSDFIKNMSHEIRTPLNILSGFAQLLAQPDTELPADVRQEASEKIQENTNRITSLVNRMLALSESSSRNRIERTDDIALNQLCRNAIAKSGVAEQQRCAFMFDTKADENLHIVTAENDAVQAISHLLDNAMKFTPEGGEIRMRCSTEEDRAVLTIEDTGCGVPGDKADDIFEEFVQLDEFQEGVGIGLSLSRNIARRLGGDLVLDTSYSDGARFVLSLPL